MGVNPISNKMILDSVMAAAGKVNSPYNLSMIILGSQIMRPKVRGDFRSAKKHYESMTDMFSDVVCVDTNGRMECLIKDLSEPIREMHDSFDMLFNGGTMEHVKDQKEGWRNAHYFLREGGVAIHVSPLSGGWPRHGLFHYEPQFFDELIERNKYKLLESQTHQHGKGEAIYVAFKKMKSGVFFWKGCEEFIEPVE